jgi:glycosyltransferase involved in cell wall biosynthesis
LETGKYSDFTIFPSYFFLPHHFTGNRYDGHKKVYAYQEWANTKQTYDIIDTIELPPELLPPPKDKWISILIPSYQTPKKHIRECLNSIRSQYGSHLGYEIVWINDGSDKVHSKILEDELALFLHTSRFCKIRCFKMIANLGVAECLRQGVELCSHEIIARMDADDIMVPHRLITQYNYLMSHPEVPMCGTGIRTFRDGCDNPRILRRTTGGSPEEYDAEMGKRIWMHDRMFPTLTLSEFQEEPKTWIMSHPSMMMRKSAILNLGNYRNVYKTFDLKDTETQGTQSILEDFDLECRILRTYGELHNIPEILMYYRIHENQITYDKTVEMSAIHSVCVSKIIGGIQEP